MHGPTSGSPLPHLSRMMWVCVKFRLYKTEELRRVRAAIEWIKVLCNTMGMLAGWLFGGREARVWPVLFFVPTLTKTCFSSQEAWEEFAPGNDRSSSWKRAQTGLEAEQKGQTFIRVQWHFLVWSIKGNFAMEGFWNVHDNTVTEAYSLLWRYPQYFNQIVLAYLQQYLRPPIPHSSLASWYYRLQWFLPEVQHRGSHPQRNSRRSCCLFGDV